ncbi:exopolysaccharide biosynthesis protein, partial [Luteimonas huabeiensis]|uniref:exopolysaccharide biosynthesis protein n=1 Tax=Luteimonas huabeiensis TaxID=1244513 RepID=UPI0005BE343E
DDDVVGVLEVKSLIDRLDEPSFDLFKYLREPLFVSESTPAMKLLEIHTAAGMTIARFGRIPNTGESFEWAGWRIEVVDLDGPRVDKLLLQRLPETAVDGAQLLIGLRKPWLPRPIAERGPQRGTLVRFERRIAPWLQRLERLVRPRLT